MANSVTTGAVQSAADSVATAWDNRAIAFLNTLSQNINDSSELIATFNAPNVSDSIGGSTFTFQTALNQKIAETPSADSTAFATPGSNPGALALTGINTTLDQVTLPGYDITSPVVSIPTKPELVTPTAPSAPELDEITIPVAPTVELPVAPTLSSVAFPDAPTLALPTFSEAAPQTPTSFLPTSQFEWSEDELDTPLLDAINGKLLTDVNDGGYGIESTDEDALWSRARDRAILSFNAIETETKERYANLGFSLPPGALLSATTRARAEADANLSELERDIAVKRAELFRSNRQFAMTQGTAVENTQLQHSGFRLERALNAQRFAAEYSVALHDAYIRQFNTELQRYTAIAEVYRTQLQGALTQIQIYEAETRSAIARQQANQIDVDLYQALLQAATTRVNLFEAQLRGAATVAEIQRLKVESYRAEVQGFTSRIAANETQLNAYRSEISGEQAKVDIFRAEVGAYSDRVQASATEHQIASDKVRVALATRDSELSAYQTNVEKYQADLSAETQRIDSILRRYSTDTDQYRAAIVGYEALSRVDIAKDTHDLEVIDQNTRRQQENARLNFAALAAFLESKYNAANAGADLSVGVVKALKATYQAIALESTDNT